MSRADVAGARQQKGDREFCGRDDIGGWGIHNHHSGLGGGVDIDVVQTDPCASHHFEILCCSKGFSIDLRGRATQNRIDIGDSRQ